MGFLVLTRRKGEAIVIGDGLATLRILNINNEQIKIGIEAPATVAVHREEIYRKITEKGGDPCRK